MDYKAATVSYLFDSFKAQVDLAKASGSIAPFLSYDNNHTPDAHMLGYACHCGQNFHSRKGSAI